ncbi:hypothetical protein [uncultured Tenacibaculum sp.]|uniref:hypothetical protein n=1 Tax=uncultured Tenacibaculum sp. TaxID=174713 RepID=UPI00262309B8|nr:hypothetical protein [uncultured Tenacibaculum sp.]
MSVLVRIEVIIEDVLEWEQSFSPEQEDYIEQIINTFKYRLERYLIYNVTGFHKINTTFSYNPITNKFKLVNCKDIFRHHITNAFERDLKMYK